MRYKRVSTSFPSLCSDTDAIWEYFCATSVRMILHRPSVLALYESIWKLAHAIDDSAERVVVLMPRKPAGIGASAYLVARKLLHSELPFVLSIAASVRNDIDAVVKVILCWISSG